MHIKSIISQTCGVSFGLGGAEAGNIIVFHTLHFLNYLRIIFANSQFLEVFVVLTRNKLLISRIQLTPRTSLIILNRILLNLTQQLSQIVFGRSFLHCLVFCCVASTLLLLLLSIHRIIERLPYLLFDFTWSDVIIPDRKGRLFGLVWELLVAGLGLLVLRFVVVVVALGLANGELLGVLQLPLTKKMVKIHFN